MSRNKLVNLIFKEAGLVEKYGSGIKRIFEYCRQHGGCTPKYREIQDGFQVVLRKTNFSGGGVNGGVSENKADQLLMLIKQNPGKKAGELSLLSNISLRTVQRLLKELKEGNFVEFLGSPKTGGDF